MIIKCLSVSGDVIPQESRLRGESEKSLYSPLNVGGSYEVYGIMHYKTRIDFLVAASGEGPMWAPSDLFEIVDNNLPNGWGYLITKNSENYSSLDKHFGINSIIGYPKLIESIEHYIGILEREVDEIKYFNSILLSY